MKTYRVTIKQIEDFYVIIDAEDENEAMSLANDKFSNGEYQESRNLFVETDDVVQICKICEHTEDDDGRCGCTNKDALE